MTLAREAGLDPDRLQDELGAPAVSQELEATASLAEALDLRGTPTVIAGRRIVAGAVDLAELLALVDAAG
jgi:protein-disulfide isomerase